MSKPHSKTFDGLAANLMERFDKLRKNDTAIAQPASASNSSFVSSGLLNSLSISFNKNRDKAEGTSNSKPVVNVSPEPGSLLIIDDMEYDDPSQDEPFTAADNLKTKNPVASQSSSNLMRSDNISPIQSRLNSASQSDFEISKRTVKDMPSGEDSELGKKSEGSSRLNSSSSLYKLGSQVFDDLARNNSTISNVANEADNLRKRFLIKKKSIESSFENFSIISKNKSENINSNPAISISAEIEDDTFDVDSQNQSSLSRTSPEQSETNDLNENANKKLNNQSLENNDLNTDTKIPSKFEMPVIDQIPDYKMKVNDAASNIYDTNNQVPGEKFEESEPVELSKTNNKCGQVKEKITPMSLISSIAMKNMHILLPVLVLAIAYLAILPRQWHYFVITFSFGLVNGIFICFLIMYVLIKIDLLSYLIDKISGTKNSDTNSKGLCDNPANGHSPVSSTQNSEQVFMNEQIHSLLIQSAIYKENKNFDGIYKGWMNELREKYSPDNYFLNKTRSVYINLDGTMLRLQTTNSKVPKRAVCNEKIMVSFNKFRIYDLTGCTVKILPTELCRKRYWSKKYPLCLSGVKLVSSSASQYKPIQTPSQSVNSIKNSNSNNNMKSSLTSSISINSINMVSMPNEPGSPSSPLLANNKLESGTLILFARTDREKEEWFKLFSKSASKSLQDSITISKLSEKRNIGFSERKNSATIISNNSNISSLKANESTSFSYNASSDKIVIKLDDPLSMPTTSSTSPLAMSQSSSSQISSQVILEQGCEIETQTENGLIYDSSLAFMNTFLIRLFADFFTHQYWIAKIQTKMQNKLNTIKLPYFMEGLNIINLDLGSVVPLIKKASEPWYDEKGLWCHLDLDYSGGVQILISTKLNLMKLKVNNNSSTPSPGVTGTNSSSSPMFTFKNDHEQSLTSSISKTEAIPSENEDENKSILNESGGSNDLMKSFNLRNGSCKFEDDYSPSRAIIDSEAEDSPESSGDEYTHSDYFNNESDTLSYNTVANDDKLVETANTSKKILNLVSKIAASNYFQKATENKYIKMAMENVSNCQLNLNVEVRKINGKLALNIPPHPSDRIWYGFVEKPEMTLVATPQVGEKEVSYSAISEWIADKLKQEFQKVLVFPNMDDFYIPILNSEIHYQNW